MPFKAFQAKVEGLQNEEVFTMSKKERFLDSRHD